MSNSPLLLRNRWIFVQQAQVLHQVEANPVFQLSRTCKVYEAIVRRCNVYLIYCGNSCCANERIIRSDQEAESGRAEENLRDRGQPVTKKVDLVLHCQVPFERPKTPT